MGTKSKQADRDRVTDLLRIVTDKKMQVSSINMHVVTYVTDK